MNFELPLKKDINQIQPYQCNIIELGWWVNKGKKIFTRNHFYNIEDTIKVIDSRNHFGVFTTAYRYNTVNQDDSYLYGNFYLDFDSDNFEHVREDVECALSYLSIGYGIKETSCNIYFSGNKGMHITIPANYLGIYPRKDLNIIFKYLASKINNYTHHKTLDLSIYDNKRLFRVPNSIHEKTCKYKIPLTYNEVKTLTKDNILALANNPRIVSTDNIVNYEISIGNFKKISIEAIEDLHNKNAGNIKYNGTLKVTPPCIQYLIDNGAKNFTRNNSIAILSSFFKASGKSLKEALDFISKWNIEKNVPPTGDMEVIRTVKSIYSTDKYFGCTKIQTILPCFKDKCTLKK